MQQTLPEPHKTQKIEQHSDGWSLALPLKHKCANLGSQGSSKQVGSNKSMGAYRQIGKELREKKWVDLWIFTVKLRGTQSVLKARLAKIFLDCTLWCLRLYVPTLTRSAKSQVIRPAPAQWNPRRNEVLIMLLQIMSHVQQITEEGKGLTEWSCYQTLWLNTSIGGR